MRVSTIQLFQQRVDALQSQQQQLSRTEMQLATGKRLVSPPMIRPPVCATCSWKTAGP